MITLDKGITVYFGYLGDFKERLLRIKNAGFTCVTTAIDHKFEWQNGKLAKQVKLIKKVGLKLSSLHASYDSQMLKNLFEDNEAGEQITKTLISEVKLAKKYGFTSLVIHLDGVGSQIGIDRLNRVLDVCKKCKMPLAVENNNDSKIIDYVFKHIDNSYLCFCYNSGHNHCFDPKKDYLKEYGHRLVALHLNDNNGESDQHTLNQYGTIDWDKIAKGLAHSNLASLDYELLMHKHGAKITEELTRSLCYKNACKLERAIKKEILKK